MNATPPENPSFEESKPARHLEHEAELTHLHAPPPELAPSRRGNSPPRKSSMRNHLRPWKIQSLDKELSYKTQIRDLESLTDGPRAANREHVEICGENLPTKSTETDLSRNHREGYMPSSSNSISLGPAQIYSRYFRSESGRDLDASPPPQPEKRPQREQEKQREGKQRGGFRRPLEGRQSPEPKRLTEKREL
ncbi:hypothetical protein Bca4012_008266 [Brassica carinata]